MIKAIKNKKLVGILSAATIALVCGISATATTITANASVDYDFTMVKGAYVRSNGDAAIRFTSKINKAQLNELVGGVENLANAKIVTLITPTRYLDEKGITTFDSTTEILMEPVEMPADEFVVNSANIRDPEETAPENYYYYNAVLYNIQEANISRKFSARSYLEVNGEIIDYTPFSYEDNSRSAWEVARAALDDENNGLSDTEETAIGTLCATYTVTIDDTPFIVKRGERLAWYEDTIKATLGGEDTTALTYNYYRGLQGHDNTQSITADTTLTATYDVVQFSLNSDNTTYSVAQGSVLNKGAEIVIPETFNGQKVTSVAANAFVNNQDITKIVLPNNVKTIGAGAFSKAWCLETVVMPGVGDNGALDLGTNAFYNCGALREIVVNKLRTTADYQVFASGDVAEGKVDVYCLGNTSNVNLGGYNGISVQNDLLSGNVYTYSDAQACGYWSWKDGVYGDEIVYTPPHDYTGKNNTCLYCGAQDAKGILYEYGTITLQDTLQVGAERVQEFTGYIVKGLQSTHTGTEVIIPAVYNDGINGEASVIAVASNAFMRNNTIVKVTLPQTVLSIGTSAFYECTALTTVIMPGVVDVFRDVTTGGMNIGDNAFTNCIALETIVISTANQIAGQKFFVNTGTYTDYTAKLKVYRYDADGKAEFSATCRFYKHNQANMFITNTQNNGTPTESELANGGYYLYSAEAPTAEDWAKTAYWWHYDANGNVVAWEKPVA